MTDLREYDVDDTWQAFLQRPCCAELRPSAEVLMRVRTRAAWPERPPSMALYEMLLHVELGHMTLDDAKSALDLNEELDRQLRAKVRGESHLKLVE